MCVGGGGVSSVTCPVGSHSTCNICLVLCSRWCEYVCVCVCGGGGGVSSVTCPVGSHSTCNICLVLCSRWCEYVCVGGRGGSLLSHVL